MEEIEKDKSSKGIYKTVEKIEQKSEQINSIAIIKTF